METTNDKFSIEDPKYQVDESFNPDKEGTWPYPKENDRWTHVHNALRGEISAMKDALDRVAERIGGDNDNALPDWAITSIKTYWDGHERHMKDHHKAEDEMLGSFVNRRFKWPERLKADHVAINEQCDKISILVGSLPGGFGDFRRAWTEYESKVLPHFVEEEAVTLPLTRAYFTHHEMSPITRKLMESSTEEEVGAMIHFMKEDRFRSEFMTQEGIPFFVWHAAFKGRVEKYRKNMVSHVDALVSGVEPPEERPSFFQSLFQ